MPPICPFCPWPLNYYCCYYYYCTVVHHQQQVRTFFHTCKYIIYHSYTFFMLTHIEQEYGSTGYGCQSCTWSAEQGKSIISPCPRSRLKIWSREMGSAVPSRTSLLISILGLNLVLTYGIPPEFRGGVHIFILKPPYDIGSVPSLSGHAIAYRWRSLQIQPEYGDEQADAGRDG